MQVKKEIPFWLLLTLIIKISFIIHKRLQAAYQPNGLPVIISSCRLHYAICLQYHIAFVMFLKITKKYTIWCRNEADAPRCRLQSTQINLEWIYNVLDYNHSVKPWMLYPQLQITPLGFIFLKTDYHTQDHQTDIQSNKEECKRYIPQEAGQPEYPRIQLFQPQ